MPAATVASARRKPPHIPVSEREAEVRLTLLGGFELLVGETRARLPISTQRVVAFIALHGRPLRRGYVSGSLWPDTREARASASLRSALWRIQARAPLITSAADELRLDERVSVDLWHATAAARRALDPAAPDVSEVERSLLVVDLLPGWYDDWVPIERERYRQLRLRALEARCELLAFAGRYGEALEMGLEALATDPLRETTHRALVRVHLAEGNVAEARRQYRICERLLRDELGVEPSTSLRELVHVT